LEATTNYSLTYDGVLLVNAGGYSSMKKMEKADASKKDRNETIVTGGALIGGLYVLGQVGIPIFERILRAFYQFYLFVLSLLF